MGQLRIVVGPTEGQVVYHRKTLPYVALLRKLSYIWQWTELEKVD